MKNLLLASLMLLLATFAQANIDLVSPDSVIVSMCQFYDSLGQYAVTAETGDSVVVDVYYWNGAGTVTADSIIYTTSSSEITIVNGQLLFRETFGDLDGSGGDGIYLITLRFIDASLGLCQSEQLTVTMGTYASIAEIASETADSTWDEDSAGHYTSPKMAFVASQTAATSLTEAGIADAVWDEDTTGHYTPGKYGYEAATVQSPWSTTDRDSVLHAMENLGFHFKMWGHNTNRELTALDEDNTTLDLNGTTIGGLNGISFPTNFSLTSINGNGQVGINLDDIYGNYPSSAFESGSLNGKGDWVTTSDLSTFDDSLHAISTKIDTILYYPDGSVLTSSRTHVGVEADTIWYWYNGIYNGRLILKHQLGSSVPDTTYYQTIGP